MRIARVIACICLAGCAGRGTAAPDAGPLDTTTRVETAEGTVEMRSVRSDPSAQFSISADPDKVWNALAVVYDELKVPVTTLDTRNRRIGFENARVRRQLGGVRMSRYLSCGERMGNPVADADDISLTLYTQVVPAGEGASTLRTLVEANAKQTGSGGALINCASTGELEKRIVSTVRQRAVR